MIASEAGSVWDIDHWVRCSDEERYAVGWTVLNRLESGEHGQTIEEVVTEPGQYAYNQEPTLEIKELSRKLIEGQIPDPTAGATHFFSPISMPKEGEPTEGFDVGGGLHEVPGINESVYFPSWTNTLTWVGDLDNVRRAYFMFYRSNRPPIADAGTDQSVSSGDLVLFNGSSSHDPDGTILSYEWDFGDVETAEGRNVTHRFRGAMNELKKYTVTLTIEDENGGTDSDTVFVTVKPLEKTVEVTHQPTIPIPGQSVFGKMTVSYNWIHDDTYVVSKIYCESGGFVGVAAISIWDCHSLIWRPIWSADIFSFGGDKERTYYPKLDQIEYGGDTFEGISVDAFDAMNIYIMGWAGISISIGPFIPPPFFETDSACFQPDYLEVPDVPVEAPNLELAHLCSPAELRVYDSHGRVTGVVDGEERNEIPNSSYYENTVTILSPTGSYTYQVVGTGEGSYGVTVTKVTEEESTTFTATDIATSANAVHEYTIDWDALSEGEKGVTVEIDSDGDGTFEKTITADSDLTQDEYLSATEEEEGIPIWVWVAMGVLAALIVLLGVLVLRNVLKRPPAQIQGGKESTHARPTIN